MQTSERCLEEQASPISHRRGGSDWPAPPQAWLAWYFDYAEGDREDEVGFRLGDERFVTGEYVSIQRNGAMHTYQVARVERP
ncbi:hypothetical protein ACVDG8_007410 [Mesorhizobium sp. ORM8.1]